MKFKEFSTWCNARWHDGCWSAQIAIQCIEIGKAIWSMPFWKREKIWREYVSATNIVENVIKPLDKKRKDYLASLD